MTPPIGRGPCPACGATEHELVSFRQDRPVHWERYDPQVAAVMLASVGMMDWDEALAVKGEAKDIPVVGKTTSTIKTRCQACRAAVTWLVADPRTVGAAIEAGADIQLDRDLPIKWEGGAT